jgi:hypothetical protein
MTKETNMKNRTMAALTFASSLFLGLSLPAQGGGNKKLLTYINSLPKQTVDAKEKAELIKMRQEEKLARDVYQALYQKWKIKAFANIAKAEQSHMDLVKLMLDRYSIKDPLTSDKIGVFPDPVFTHLFQVLVLAGYQSPALAELVGAFIEDLDIYDLDLAMGHTDNRDINTVWQNLQRGSRNHMRAFYGLLKTQSILYPGIVLPLSRILSIVNSAWENKPVDENGKAL